MILYWIGNSITNRLSTRKRVADMKVSEELAKEVEEKHGKGWAIALMTMDKLLYPEPMSWKEWAMEYLPLPILLILFSALVLFIQWVGIKIWVG